MLVAPFMLRDYMKVMDVRERTPYTSLIGRVTYSPVRPRESDYDVNYYNK